MKKLIKSLLVIIIFWYGMMYSMDHGEKTRMAEEKVLSLVSLLEKALQTPTDGVRNEDFLNVVLAALLTEIDQVNELKSGQREERGCLTIARDGASHGALNGNITITAEMLQQLVASVLQASPPAKEVTINLYDALPVWFKVASAVISTMTIFQFLSKCYEWSGLKDAPKTVSREEVEVMLKKAVMLPPVNQSLEREVSSRNVPPTGQGFQKGSFSKIPSKGVAFSVPSRTTSFNAHHQDSSFLVSQDPFGGRLGSAPSFSCLKRAPIASSRPPSKAF